MWRQYFKKGHYSHPSYIKAISSPNTSWHLMLLGTGERNYWSVTADTKSHSNSSWGMRLLEVTVNTGDSISKGSVQWMEHLTQKHGGTCGIPSVISTFWSWSLGKTNPLTGGRCFQKELLQLSRKISPLILPQGKARLWTLMCLSHICSMTISYGISTGRDLYSRDLGERVDTHLASGDITWQFSHTKMDLY